MFTHLYQIYLPLDLIYLFTYLFNRFIGLINPLLGTQTELVYCIRGILFPKLKTQNMYTLMLNNEKIYACANYLKLKFENELTLENLSNKTLQRNSKNILEMSHTQRTEIYDYIATRY